MVKYSLRFLLIVFIALVLFTIFSNIVIISNTSDQVFRKIEDIPAKETAIVLGTSKRTASGESNDFFNYRMLAAAELIKSGKANRLLLSGDNRTRFYNEPGDMKDALIKLGIPDSIIEIDSAGNRTIESITRCKEVFNHDDIIIITQEFHAYRAIFISNYHNMNAVAYTAEDVPLYSSTQVNIREFFARPKAIIDLYMPFLASIEKE